MLRSQVLAADSASINGVSGATFTSEAYVDVRCRRPWTSCTSGDPGTAIGAADGCRHGGPGRIGRRLLAHAETAMGTVFSHGHHGAGRPCLASPRLRRPPVAARRAPCCIDADAIFQHLGRRRAR